MGRRTKFGEESGFVNVRVSKSKISEYREAINKLVNEKFTRDSCEAPKEGKNMENEKKAVSFRDFREFGDTIAEGTASEPEYENNFIAEVFEEVEKLGKHEKRSSERR